MGAAELEFSDIYAKYYEKLNSYLEHIVGRNDAEDLTQEVFLKINKGMQDFKGDSSLSTWVYRIATNAALDKARSRAYRESKQTAKLKELSPETENEFGVDARSLSAEREAIRNEMNACIQEFIDKLPPDYCVVIRLSEIKDLRNQQIADILGLSLDAVKIRLHRARTRLKAEFEAGCSFYHDEDGKLACDRKKPSKKGD